MIRLRWLCLPIGFALILFATSPVLAHANLFRSTPVANASLQNTPDEIRLWFTEPVEPNYSSVTLRDRGGNLVNIPKSQSDSNDARQLFVKLSALPKGLYTVAWRAVSAADGHSTNGSFAFGIGVPVADNPASLIDESVVPDSIVIRWLNLIGLSLMVGSIGFWLFVCPVLALPDHGSIERRWYQLAWLGWFLVGISTLLLLMLQVSINDNTSLFRTLVDSSFSASSDEYFLWIFLASACSAMGLIRARALDQRAGKARIMDRIYDRRSDPRHTELVQSR